MAITPGTEPTLDAAARWKDECLLSDGSILAPGASLWTLGHLEELDRHFVQNPKEGKRHFLEKMKEQLDGASPGAIQLMAEMLWVMMLFPSNFNHDTKVRKIRTVWEWAGKALPDSPMLDAVLARGIGSTGPGFVNHQPAELEFLILVASEIKKQGVEDRRGLLGDPWRLDGWLDGFEDVGQRQLRHILTHLLHPEQFERIASAWHKTEILKAFGREEESRHSDLLSLDRALLDLRAELHREYPDRPQLDFYRPPLVERWQLGEPPELVFDEEALDHARRAFLARYPDFEDFETPGQRFQNEERGYKDVLRDRFRDLAAELPPIEDLTPADADRIVKDVQDLLTSNLEPYGWSQNLIGWRYTSFLRDLDDGEKMVFARALIELLDEEIAPPARAERFAYDMAPLLEAHGVTGYAASRSIPSLFLFLNDPDRDIYIRTDLFTTLAKHFTGEKLFLNKRLDMNEYQKAVAFANAVREKLEEWEWGPGDLIDVQSFMWGAEQSWDEVEPIPSPGGSGQVRDTKPPYGDTGTRDLADIVQLLEDDGLHFPPELVANYLLALQTKRFVILTGISGTGKTKLAMRIGEFFAAETQGGHGGRSEEAVQVVAVRPDWTDPRGLIGYHNPITEQYVTTDFLRLLMRAREEEDEANREDRPARPFFVILDEMNLARVEHYFSDFLSALESNRDLSLHNASDGAVPPRLRIPRNVFFTGTVNVDETTHMFSPKVLDRAFTLELNEVDLDGWALAETDRPGAPHALRLPKLDAHLRWQGEPGAEDWVEFGGLLEGRLRETVTALNAALAPWGYHFGYRVAGEIARFVLLARRQGANADDALWSALDLALLEKVLPKFHGTEQELEPPLRTVLFVARHARAPTEGEELGDAAEPAGTADPEPVRLPRCADKAGRMLRRLRARGFAAFIE